MSWHAPKSSNVHHRCITAAALLLLPAELVTCSLLTFSCLGRASAQASGKASCSGLSLLLVAACRSVGIAARVAGVGDWGAQHGGGNHVWCEIYHAGSWHHIGAAEPSALDETWFDERLRPADGARVFASTYRRADDETLPDGTALLHHFPLPWRDDESDASAGLVFPAVEVTSRYRAPEQRVCA